MIWQCVFFLATRSPCLHQSTSDLILDPQSHCAPSRIYTKVTFPVCVAESWNKTSRFGTSPGSACTRIHCTYVSFWFLLYSDTVQNNSLQNFKPVCSIHSKRKCMACQMIYDSDLLLWCSTQWHTDFKYMTPTFLQAQNAHSVNKKQPRERNSVEFFYYHRFLATNFEKLIKRNFCHWVGTFCNVRVDHHLSFSCWVFCLHVYK